MSTITADMRRQALLRANEKRIARAELRRAIFAGEITVARVLADRPPEADTWPIRDLVASQRQWGRSRTLRLLSHAGIPEAKPVGQLTDRQRDVIAAGLGHRTTAAGEGEGNG